MNMTSTSINVGLADGKVSSRVLRPPGGGHTDIFGGDPEPPRRGRGRPQAPFGLHEEKTTNGTAQNGEANGDSHKQAPETQIQEPEPQVQEAAPNESPVKEPQEVKPVEAPKFEPPKRVRVPPGGFSSGLW